MAVPSFSLECAPAQKLRTLEYESRKIENIANYDIAYQPAPCIA